MENNQNEITQITNLFIVSTNKYWLSIVPWYFATNGKQDVVPIIEVQNNMYQKFPSLVRVDELRIMG